MLLVTNIGGSPRRSGNVYIPVCDDVHAIGEEKVRTGIDLLVHKRAIIKRDRPRCLSPGHAGGRCRDSS